MEAVVDKYYGELGASCGFAANRFNNSIIFSTVWGQKGDDVMKIYG